VIFEFDPDVVSHIGAFQLSYLVVHEWLWNLVGTAQQNRELNYYIHSKLFDTESAASVQTYFKKNGVHL